MTAAKTPATINVSHPTGVVVIQVHIAEIFALIAVVKAPVAKVAPLSLAVNAILVAVISPFATAWAFCVTIFSRALLAWASVAAFSANSETVKVSVAVVSPQLANVSAEILAVFDNCSAVYSTFAEVKVAITKHCSFCSSVNSFEDNKTFCWAASRAEKEESNFTLFPVLFNTVDILLNCSLNTVLIDFKYCLMILIYVYW